MRKIVKQIGFLVNPLAGIGGKVGLKGSDGDAVIEEAFARGAIPESEEKACIALEILREAAEGFEIITCPGAMGENACKKVGLPCRVISHEFAETGNGQGSDAGKKTTGAGASKGKTKSVLTTARDTISMAAQLVDEGIELLFFAGGDGTARNILDAVGNRCVVLGVPAGCKIHSGTYAVSPRMAGILLHAFITGKIASFKAAEVMDIDEQLFRNGIVQAKLYGYLSVPADDRFLQNRKNGSQNTEQAAVEAISCEIAENMEEDILYIMSTGSTTAAIMKNLGLPYTLLGVDLISNRTNIAMDCTEEMILHYLSAYTRAKIIVTVIGGQGHIFGRGNQQISAEVIRKVGRDNIMIAATQEKLLSLPNRCIYVDTGDEEVNQWLEGYMPVLVGYRRTVMIKVVS